MFHTTIGVQRQDEQSSSCPFDNGSLSILKLKKKQRGLMEKQKTSKINLFGNPDIMFFFVKE